MIEADRREGCADSYDRGIQEPESLLLYHGSNLRPESGKYLVFRSPDLLGIPLTLFLSAARRAPVGWGSILPSLIEPKIVNAISNWSGNPKRVINKYKQGQKC